MANATIFDRLQRDHDTHRQFFTDMADLREEAARRALFDRFVVEVTTHAAAEEEEEEMFPDAAQDMSAAEEQRLGRRFARRKPAEREHARTAG